MTFREYGEKPQPPSYSRRRGEIAVMPMTVDTVARRATDSFRGVRGRRSLARQHPDRSCLEAARLLSRRRAVDLDALAFVKSQDIVASHGDGMTC
jgi:hypothetical protein